MENLRQALRDAGCGDRECERILGLWDAGLTRDAGQALRLHRRTLMEQLHDAQDRVDCLDWLLRRMEREQKSGCEGGRKGWQ